MSCLPVVNWGHACTWRLGTRLLGRSVRLCWSETTLQCCRKATWEEKPVWTLSVHQSTQHPHYTPSSACGLDYSVPLFLQLLNEDVIMLLSWMLRGLINYVYETLWDSQMKGVFRIVRCYYKKKEWFYCFMLMVNICTTKPAWSHKDSTKHLILICRLMHIHFI